MADKADEAYEVIRIKRSDYESLAMFLLAHERQIAAGVCDECGTLWALLGGIFDAVHERSPQS